MQKAVGDLIKKSFFIPYYQRGYKWDKLQIEALLNDLWEFHRFLKKRTEGYKYYSLQPLVVKEHKDKYIVVDGQQRLTTIYLILSAIEETLNEEIKKFSLEYERDGSQEFLKNITKKNEQDLSNIDFHYMFNSYTIIKQWIHNQEISDPNLKKFRDFILSDTDWDEDENKDLNENIRFIWYEINDEESEFDVFVRLNIGKIPLTNAELIKSFIIQNSQDTNPEIKKQKRFEMASEWDNIEYSFEDEEFFGFITKESYKTKIEILFQIYLNVEKYDNYELYEEFIAKNEDNMQEIWQKIKHNFHLLQSWYKDRELYHLIGYLTNIGFDIVKIFQTYEKSKTKEGFKNELKKEIYYSVLKNFSSFEEIKELSYNNSNDKKILMRVFLLHNIITLISSSKDSFLRFSFYKFNHDKWSIEHISPQTDKGISADILSGLKEFISNDNNKKIKDIFDKKKIEQDEIRILENIFADEKINGDKDNIKNLTLLSSKNNSSLKNNFFPIKRNMIIDMDKKGEFIPIVTKNLFLKYYSEVNSNPGKWTIADGKSYVDSIINSFEIFFKGTINE